MKVTSNDIWNWVGQYNKDAADTLKIALKELLDEERTVEELREEILTVSKAYSDKRIKLHES